MPRHGELFLEARKPRIIYVRPEPEWVLDSDRVRAWYYRDAPEVGALVRYLRDGYTTRITHVGTFHITFQNGLTIRRPHIAGRLGAWVLPRLTIITSDLTARAAAGFATGRRPNQPGGSRSPLRPDATTLLV